MWGFEFDYCPKCSFPTVKGGPCQRCPPDGKVACPYSLGRGHTASCLACKGTGWVEEIN